MKWRTFLLAFGMAGLLPSGPAFAQDGMGMGMGMGMGAADAQDEPIGPAPTYGNVAYGPDELNVLDFWQAEAASPTPLIIYYHAGGFVGGSKDSLASARVAPDSSLTNADILQAFLDAGISVASADYGLTPDAPLPASFTDSMHALQFLRSKSEEWNIDKSRVGAFGDSSGAAISMWLAFHDEMADPHAADAVARESTRLSAVASRSAPTVIDAELWAKWIPGMDGPPAAVTGLVFESDDPDVRGRIAADISALPNVSAGDPPIYMAYRMAPDDPVPTEGLMGWQIHHVVFGLKLKEKADALGLEVHLNYPGVESAYPSVVEFFGAKLLAN